MVDYDFIRQVAITITHLAGLWAIISRRYYDAKHSSLTWD